MGVNNNKKKNTTQITGEYIITGNTGTTAVVRYLYTGEVKYLATLPPPPP